MEYFVISAKFVPLKYYTLSSQLQRLTSFSVGCSGRRILSPGQIAVMRKWSIQLISHFLSYLQNYKEFKAKILDLQPEKYGLSFDIKKCTTSGWALGMRMWSA